MVWRRCINLRGREREASLAQTDRAPCRVVAMTPTCDASSLTVHNELAEPLRLRFLADDASLSFTLPPHKSELAPRQRVSLTLPSDKAGWLVGERRAWRSLVGADELTHVVRRAINRSSGVRTVAPPPASADDEDAAVAARRFLLLVSAERQPLLICGGVGAACHGLLPPHGQRYLRGLPRGSMLEAYEAVWGERWTPTASAAAAVPTETRTRRVTRPVPFAQAGFALP